MNEPDLTLVVFALNEIEGLKAVGPRINTQKKFLKRVLISLTNCLFISTLKG